MSANQTGNHYKLQFCYSCTWNWCFVCYVQFIGGLQIHL